MHTYFVSQTNLAKVSTKRLPAGYFIVKKIIQQKQKDDNDLYHLPWWPTGCRRWHLKDFVFPIAVSLAAWVLPTLTISGCAWSLCSHGKSEPARGGVYLTFLNLTVLFWRRVCRSGLCGRILSVEGWEVAYSYYISGFVTWLNSIYLGWYRVNMYTQMNELKVDMLVLCPHTKGLLILQRSNDGVVGV